ncbi:MAG: DUF2076 domain-containing protein [Halochromatium sp.]|nr:DUF2076 domain-containing protein [Halochromatium sp.]
MNVQDQTAIEGLFERLRQAESQSGPRDAEAERLIGSLVQQQPAAPYLMAQAVIVQEHALQQLQSRVETLEKELASRPQAGGGGFLGGLFGAGAAPQPPAAPPAPSAAPGRPVRSGGWGSQTAQQPQAAAMQGGGFLAGAMQTAVGVAGGVLLGNAIGGLFSDHAEAAPADAAPADAGALDDPGLAEPDLPAEDDGGGFFDDFGDEEF